jgi:hypothetical protein
MHDIPHSCWLMISAIGTSVKRGKDHTARGDCSLSGAFGIQLDFSRKSQDPEDTRVRIDFLNAIAGE